MTGRSKPKALCCPDRLVTAMGLCSTHYQRYKTGRHSYLQEIVDQALINKRAKAIATQERAYQHSIVSRRTPEYRDRTRFRRYGIDEAQFHTMLNGQDGKCKLCLKELVQGKTYIDHCHKTHRVRALLCPGCNTFVAVIENKYHLVGEALEYIGTYGEML